MPSDCMDILKLLRGSGEERQEAVRLLFDLDFIRYYSIYWHKRYMPQIEKKYPDWQDLYTQVVIEIVNEVEEGRGPKTSCKGYVSRLCQNLCEKAIREIKSEEAFDASLLSLLTGSSELRDWIDLILKKMECKCASLLRFRYLQVPPVNGNETLAERLKEDCGKVYSPSAIPVHLHDCREKFRQLAQDNPFDFDNLHS